ncbi:hypothetical protein NDU88_009685 [Pleurodeles waltl]|uniref:Uncharacterized protein n=1 Tax=Pleurodeles waltl TaxID=8319 RepID=A0AAV7RXA3_PLEWA|nr:hypothetical protein NDU88_009685 [Pleurodeles waltl]
MGHLRSADQHTSSIHQASPWMMAATLGRQGQVDCPFSLADKLDTVLVVIEQSGTSLEAKINTVATNLTMLHAGHRKLADKVEVTEQTLSTLQPKTQSMESFLQTPSKRKQVLEMWAED